MRLEGLLHISSRNRPEIVETEIDTQTDEIATQIGKIEATLHAGIIGLYFMAPEGIVHLAEAEAVSHARSEGRSSADLPSRRDQ